MDTQEHDSRRIGAVGVIRRLGRFLLIRRSQSVIAPGAYCFPGGGIERGETEEMALVRELQEELGVTVEPVRRIWQSVTPWQVRLAWWQAELPRDASLVPNPAEVESVHWCTPEEMARLPELLQSNRHFLESLGSGQIELR